MRPRAKQSKQISAIALNVRDGASHASKQACGAAFFVDRFMCACISGDCGWCDFTILHSGMRGVACGVSLKITAPTLTVALWRPTRAHAPAAVVLGVRGVAGEAI